MLPAITTMSKNATGMENFTEIKNAVASMDQDETEDAKESTDGITIMGSDPIVNLQNQVNRLMSENTDLSKRVSSLEAKIVPLIMDTPAKRRRSKVKVPKRDMFGMTPPPAIPDAFDSSSSIVNVAPSLGPDPDENGSVDTYASANPFSTTSEGVYTSKSVFKSNSAIAPQGYVGKKSVWGTALASFLTAACRYYIAKKNHDMMMIDELKLMKNCIVIAPTLYFAAMHKELPDVKSPATRYLSAAIARSDKNDVPVSDATTWTDMLKYQDGKDVMSVINTMISMLKMVPESVVHPVSQMVMLMIPPVARVVDEKRIFAMSAEGSPSTASNQWELWCSILKEPALTKYIKYRLASMKPIHVMSKMVSEMRDSDLTDSKNKGVMKDLVPFTMRCKNVSGS